MGVARAFPVRMRASLALVLAAGIAGGGAFAEKGPRALDLAAKLHTERGDQLLRRFLRDIEEERAAGVKAPDRFSLITRRKLRRAPERMARLSWSARTTPLWVLLDLRRLLYRVGHAIAEHTDASGHLDLPALRARHGARLAALLEALHAMPGERWDAAIHHVGGTGSPRLLRRLAHTDPVARPPMAALEELVAARREGRPLAGVEVLALQHLLGSTGGLLHAFADSGAPPHRIHVMGKPYSEHPLVVDHLRRDGFRVLNERLGARAGPEWLLRLHAAVTLGWDAPRAEAELVRRLSRATGRRVLLVDDGGALIRFVNDVLARHPELRGRVVAVEQTRKGLRSLEGVTLHLPVIAVGDAWAKLEYEAPMIGRSVAGEVHAHLEHLRSRGIAPGSRVVILGYGVVGRATARMLARLGYRVEAWDKGWDADPAARARAAADGVVAHRSRDVALSRASILVSTAGERTVAAADYGKLPHGAVLFNGASPGELDDAPLVAGATRRTFLGRSLDALQPDVRPRRGFSVAHVGGRDILVAAKGHVINFGSVDPIPPRYIQLTRGLLYLGALQAVATREAGVHPLALDPQRGLVDAVQRDLARTGESLLDPRF